MRRGRDHFTLDKESPIENKDRPIEDKDLSIKDKSLNKGQRHFLLKNLSNGSQGPFGKRQETSSTGGGRLAGPRVFI